MKMKKRIASFLVVALMIFATIPGRQAVLANESPTLNLGNYAGLLSGIIEDLTGWANDFEAYADSDNLREPINMDLETFEGFLTRLYGYTSNLREIHTSMGTHDLDVLPFGDNWPGPRPPWSMVLMNVEMVLLGGLGYGYEYLQSYIAEPFIAPTSEAVIYFIHEMNMGNPEESGFLGCVNCIRNLMFMLGHLGEMMGANETPTPNLRNYAGQLSGIIGDLTGWANDFEAYADSDNFREPINMDLETFEGFLTRLYGYTSNLREIHTSMGTHDLDVLPFGDNWPGPRPPWSMVLMNVEMVLLGGLGYGYEYLQSYIAEPFTAPTSEAVIYFIHEMNMGNPEESGFLGCVNCIRNLMFMLGHLGEMMAEQAAHQPELPISNEVVEPIAAEPIPPSIAEYTAPAIEVLAPQPEYITAANIATVTAYALNLRRGPGVSYTAFNYLVRGDTITVLSQRGNWFQVETYRGTGWVFGRYINVQ